MIYVGTSGYSYSDWTGAFYPPGTKPKDMLPYYAAHFPAVELDFTYYRMPEERTIRGMAEKTPAGFQFCVKAHKTMTHEVPASVSEVRSTFEAFRAAMEPLVAAGKMACLLAQFPWSFRPLPENRDFLLRFKELVGDIPVAVEFRNHGWVSEEMFRFLEENWLAFCGVDEPALRGLMPPVVAVTSDLAYIRFHGRNAARWWKHDQPWERYDYLYSEEELAEWLPKILDAASRAKKTFVLFNNCHAGQAARNARMLQVALGPSASGRAQGKGLGHDVGAGASGGQQTTLDL